MERMVIGRTGLEVHRLGFGGIPIQRVSEAQAVETVLQAVHLGVDFIDTSRAYTTSERRIGLALKYALAQPGILVIAGVERKELIDENWKVFQEGQGLTEKEKKEIEETQKHYEKVFCRRCDYCQPCPEEIPIQMVLGIRSMVKRMGKGILQKGAHRGGIEKGRKCTECGVCTTRCPYELPIPELIKKNLCWADEQTTPLRT